VCSHEWTVAPPRTGRFRSVDELVRRTGIRRDEVVVLAEIGALNSLGHDRRSALWQVERAVRPAGEMFEEGMPEGPGFRPSSHPGHRPGSPLPATTDTAASLINPARPR